MLSVNMSHISFPFFLLPSLPFPLESRILAFPFSPLFLTVFFHIFLHPAFIFHVSSSSSRFSTMIHIFLFSPPSFLIFILLIHFFLMFIVTIVYFPLVTITIYSVFFLLLSLLLFYHSPLPSSSFSSFKCVPSCLSIFLPSVVHSFPCLIP